MYSIAFFSEIEAEIVTILRGLVVKLCVLSIGLFIAGGAQATILYSINALTDKLVTIDAHTLATTDIGFLGLDIDGSDGLAFTDAGNLYATFSINNEYGFYSIDVLFGSATLHKSKLCSSR